MLYFQLANSWAIFFLLLTFYWQVLATHFCDTIWSTTTLTEKEVLKLDFNNKCQIFFQKFYAQTPENFRQICCHRKYNIHVRTRTRTYIHCLALKKVYTVYTALRGEGGGFKNTNSRTFSNMFHAVYTLCLFQAWSSAQMPPKLPPVFRDEERIFSKYIRDIVYGDIWTRYWT